MNGRTGKLLYHITALENLESIFQYGLLARTDAVVKGIIQKDIADPEIIEKRKVLGILQYVPFHFFEKTAFAGAVYKAHPDVSFCAITIHRDFAKANNFKICTAHPLSDNPTAQVLDYDAGFSAIDWDSLEAHEYGDKRSKNAGMSECLATSPVLPKNFHSIYVASEKMKKYVEDLAQRILRTCSFYVNINKSITQEVKK